MEIEKAITKTEMPEHVQNFKKLSELSPAAGAKAIRDDRLFSNKNGFKVARLEELSTCLFQTNGRVAGMTVIERENWYL